MNIGGEIMNTINNFRDNCPLNIALVIEDAPKIVGIKGEAKPVKYN